MPNDGSGRFQTPLGAAVFTQNLDIAALLLESGADINPGWPDLLGTATSTLSLKTVKFLLDHGAKTQDSMAHAGAISALEDQFLDDWVPFDEEILLEQEKCYQILDLLAERGAAQLDQPAI